MVMVLMTACPWATGLSCAKLGLSSFSSLLFPPEKTRYPEDDSEQDPQPLWLTRSPPMIRDREEIILHWLWWASPNTLLRIGFVGPPFADCHSLLTSKVVSLSEYVLLILLERSEKPSQITATILKLVSKKIHFPNHISVYSLFVIVLWPRL